jgi:hypothetical protein
LPRQGSFPISGFLTLLSAFSSSILSALFHADNTRGVSSSELLPKNDLALLSKSMPLLAFLPPTIFLPWRGGFKMQALQNLRLKKKCLMATPSEIYSHP